MLHRERTLQVRLLIAQMVEHRPRPDAVIVLATPRPSAIAAVSMIVCTVSVHDAARAAALEHPQHPSARSDRAGTCNEILAGKPPYCLRGILIHVNLLAVDADQQGVRGPTPIGSCGNRDVAERGAR